MSAIKRLNISDKMLQELKNKYSPSQEQTADIFGFKWAKRDTYESDAVKKFARDWQWDRYGDNCQKLLDWLDEGERKIILDAGCGSAFSALMFFGDHLHKHDFLGIDISSAVNVAKERFAEKNYPGDFFQCSLMELPFADGMVDLIFSEGVLHHTDSTEKAIKYLGKKLKKGGKFLFYVYAKKSVVREFTDDLVRESIKHMSDEEAWKALEPLTKLGIALGELKTDIEIPEDIPYLGIKKGKMDIQRFFYWYVCKMYYRPEMNLDEMNHINFDWFRPMNCHRQTPEQVSQWCTEAGLEIEHMNVQESGISVIARKL
jgi:SAM-dependent methyltransferase